jgi:hypothetical protein
MKTINIILLSLFCVTVHNAQDKKDFITDTLTLRWNEVPLKESLQKIGINDFTIDNEKQILILSYPDVPKTIAKVDRLKGKVNGILVPYIAPKVETPKTVVVTEVMVEKKKQPKYDPKIDEWLNIEDSSIFLENFMPEVTETQVNPNRRAQFNLIKNIRTCTLMLEEVEKATNEEDKKNKLSETKKVFDEVSKVDRLITQPLSREQKDFYLQQAKKYETLYSSIYK